MATNGSFTQQDQYKSATEQYPATSTDATTGASSGNEDLSKDEVGWYFVEQYYTTLSKNPEKLHLFYGKRSQFVSGLEAEVSPVSVGRSAIQQRIKELDFQDCKVRVSNVDSQASFDNIVIQVIGETSNKSAELKKFVQTFVLAQQPTGYFVLNDIFRYINEEGEEEVDEAAAAPEESTPAPLVEDVEMPKSHASADEPASTTLDADVVDKKLETVDAETAAEAPSTNGTGETKAEEEETPVEDAKAEEEIITPEVAEKAVEEETVKEPEKPADPTPTPAISRAQSTTKPAAPVQPAAPAKPLTWASRAAAAAGPPKPAVPVVAPKSTSTPPAQARAAPPSTPAKPVQTQTTTVSTAASAEKDKENNPPTPGGWQTAGSDHAKRQNRPQSISGPPEKEGTMGYVRNVTEKVAEADLRSALAGFGNLIYFDINRGKNCAFVEYSTPEGYLAAAAANPHKVGGEDIYVEPRRPKAGAYGGNSYTGPRGGINQRGRSGFDQGRPGSQGGRGNFGQSRGGRGGGAPRGRGTSQATNA